MRDSRSILGVSDAEDTSDKVDTPTPSGTSRKGAIRSA